MQSALAATEATLVQDVLENLTQCAKLFVDAQDAQRIQLADDMVPAALGIIARRLEQAAEGSPQARSLILRALADSKLRQRCEEAVEKATHRVGPIHGHDFAAWLECEGI